MQTRKNFLFRYVQGRCASTTMIQRGTRHYMSSWQNSMRKMSLNHATRTLAFHCLLFLQVIPNGTWRASHTLRNSTSSSSSNLERWIPQTLLGKLSLTSSGQSALTSATPTTTSHFMQSISSTSPYKLEIQDIGSKHRLLVSACCHRCSEHNRGSWLFSFIVKRLTVARPIILALAHAIALNVRSLSRSETHFFRLSSCVKVSRD